MLDITWTVLYNSEVSSSQRGVAQLGRALRSGRRGRRFKSCRLDLSALHRLRFDNLYRGSLVKRLRRRPLTAETGVRFP